MPKWLWLVVLFALIPSSAFANARVQGNCEQGGVQVSVADGAASSTTTAGAATNWQQSFPSCTVTVYTAGTTTLASIFSDNSGTVLANPFTAAADGSWFFYAANGRYDVKLSGGGISSPFTRGDFTALATDAAIAFTANNTHTGTETFTQLSGCQYVNANQTFAAALTAAGSSGCMVINPGVYTVSANATIPVGVSLNIPSGGILSVANGVTLTINGAINAPVNQQLFQLIGTGVVNFGPGTKEFIPQWWGAVPSVTTETATTASGSTAVTLGAAGDFANNQPVTLIGAGPTCSLAAPTAVVITESNGSGTTSYTYDVTAVGPNGCETVASAATTFTTGTATLGGATWLKISWTASPGTVQYYRVYGCSGAACTPKYVGFSYATVPAYTDYSETGVLGVGQSTIVPPASATRDNLFTYIASGGGTTSLTLGTAPSVSSSSILFEHDNYTPITQALNVSNSGAIFLPQGRYAIAGTPKATQSNKFYGVCGPAYGAPAETGPQSTRLVWQGQDASLAFRSFDTVSSEQACFSLDVTQAASGGALATSSSMMGYYVDSSNISSFGGASGSWIHNIYVTGSKVGFQNGGNFCVNSSAPSCDTSAMKADDITVYSTLTSSTGFIWKSSNSGDVTKWSNLENAVNGTYGFRALNIGGGYFVLDRPQCNGSMQAGGSCIDLESPGSGVYISGYVAQASGISYAIRAPAGQSGNGGGLYYLYGNIFGNNVSFETTGLIMSIGNIASSNVTMTVSAGGANVISIGDNLWNPWTASGGGTVPFAFGRNFNTGATVYSLNIPGTNPIFSGVNNQTGTSYTMVAADEQKLVTFNNTNPVAVTLPQATTAGFGAGTVFHVRNAGTGLVTVTPTTSTIDSGATITLAPAPSGGALGQGADIYSDGANYFSNRGGLTVASGTAVMPTAAIASGACSATVTVAATGASMTSDAVFFSYNNGVPGANPGVLIINSGITTGNVNFQYCNPGAGSITPVAATLNWRVMR